MRGLLFRLMMLWIMVGIGAVMAIVGGGQSASFLLGCTLFLAIVGTVGAFFAAGRLELSRGLHSAFLRQGDSLMVEGEVTLARRYPLLFVIVIDQWIHEQTGKRLCGASVLFPFGRQKLSFTYSLSDLKRGVYRLADTETIVADLLYLSVCRRRMPADRTIDPVYVQPVPLPHIADSQLRRLSRMDTASIGGLRDYMAGDSLRSVDWKSYLHHGRLMTKLPERMVEPRTVLVLDPGASSEQFERAIGAAAGYIAGIHSAEGIELGLVNGEQCLIVRIDSVGMSALLRALTEAVRPTTGRLRDLLASGKYAAGVEGEIVFVTGRLDEPIARAVLDFVGMESASILYASAKPVLSVVERAMVRTLEQGGLDFGFVPNRLGWPNRAEVPVYG